MDAVQRLRPPDSVKMKCIIANSEPNKLKITTHRHSARQAGCSSFYKLGMFNCGNLSSLIKYDQICKFVWQIKNGQLAEMLESWQIERTAINVVHKRGISKIRSRRVSNQKRGRVRSQGPVVAVRWGVWMNRVVWLFGGN